MGRLVPSGLHVGTRTSGLALLLRGAPPRASLLGMAFCRAVHRPPGDGQGKWRGYIAHRARQILAAWVPVWTPGERHASRYLGARVGRKMRVCCGRAFHVGCALHLVRDAFV